jgi:hypothetical protein
MLGYAAMQMTVGEKAATDNLRGQDPLMLAVTWLSAKLLSGNGASRAVSLLLATLVCAASISTTLFVVAIILMRNGPASASVTLHDNLIAIELSIAVVSAVVGCLTLKLILSAAAAKVGPTYQFYLLFFLSAYIVLNVTPGLLISSISSSHDVVRIWDHEEWPFAAIMYIVVAPLLWSFYVSQPGWIAKMLSMLQTDRSILVPTSQDGPRDYNEFLRQAGDYLAERHSALPVSSGISERCQASRSLRSGYAKLGAASPVSVGCALGAFLLVIIFCVRWSPTSSVPIFFSKPRPSWITICKGYLGIWKVVNQGMVYVVVWAFVRNLAAIISINRLFKSYRIEPDILHHDQCNGLAPIGDYVLKSSSMSLVLGAIVMYGAIVNSSVNSLVLCACYVVLLPFTFIVPMWRTHLAMAESKTSNIRHVGKEVSRLLKSRSLLTSERMGARMRDLMLYVRLFEERQREWPIAFSQLGAVTVFLLLPLLANVVAALIVARL